MFTLLSPRTRFRATTLLTAAALFTGCGGGDKAPTPPPVVTGTLAVALTPNALSLAPGAAGPSVAAITRGGGFTGNVELTATGAPTGVTVTFGATTLGAGVTSASILVSTIATAAPGEYRIVITAAGTGVTTATATLTLIVAAVATPTVAVTVAPTTLSIVAGASGSSAATLVRGGGFAGAVALTSTGAPAAMTVTFTPASVAAGATTSAIAIAVGGSVAAGSYPVVISAAGTGVTTDTATLTVTVTAPAGGSAVTLSYCAADAPIWVAYQDGAGAWTRVNPTGTNTYQFTVSSARAGVATVDTAGTGFDLNVTYATAAEFNGFGNTQSLGACGSKTVNGTVTNVSNTQFANVTLGYSSAFVLPITSSAFTLTKVAAGPQDLFASRLTAATQRVDKIILRRAVDVVSGGSLAVLDFNAAEAFAPGSGNVTVTGLGADTATIATLFNGVRGSTFGFIGTISDYLAASGAVAYDAVPSANLNSGELQQLYAFASSANSTTSTRFSGIFFRSPTDRTIAIGPVLSTPTVTRDAAGAYSRVRVQLGLQSDYNRYLSADFSQTTLNRSTSILVTTGYTAGSAWDLTIPDLSGATGWLSTWGLQNGTAIDWNVTALGGAIYQLDATVADGSTFKSATRSSATPLP
jgi:hypothetical protein